MSQESQPPNKKPPPTTNVPGEIPETDVQKLQAEILQLRNQQFIIGTLALTGEGFALWALTNLPKTNTGKIPGLSLIGILVVWFLFLGFLFYWSLSLRKIITIISIFLKRNTVGGQQASPWEEWYFDLPKKNRKIKIESQTELVKMAFVWYGLIACLVSIINSHQHGVEFNLEIPWLFELILLLIFLFFGRIILTIKHNFDQENENLEKNIFAKDESQKEHSVKSWILNKMLSIFIKIDPVLIPIESQILNEVISFLKKSDSILTPIEKWVSNKKNEVSMLISILRNIFASKTP